MEVSLLGFSSQLPTLQCPVSAPRLVTSSDLVCTSDGHCCSTTAPSLGFASAQKKYRIKCKRVFFSPFLTPIHQGTAANPGINQRALQLLFSEVRGKAADWDYTITVSAAEIYNEALRYGEGGRSFSGHHPMLLSPTSLHPCLGLTTCPRALGAAFGPARIYF